MVMFMCMYVWPVNIMWREIKTELKQDDEGENVLNMLQFLKRERIIIATSIWTICQFVKREEGKCNTNLKKDKI